MKRAHLPTQRGFAAIAAIFIVVLLAALGGFMVTFSNTQQLTAAQDIQGSRAYWAARAGLEWGIGSVAASAAAPPVCPASPTTLAAVFDGGFTVTITCSRTDFIEGANSAYIFQITATAKSSGTVGSVGYIERSLSASIER
jgi:MSHA biogenesis protein MshP